LDVEKGRGVRQNKAGFRALVGYGIVALVLAALFVPPAIAENGSDEYPPEVIEAFYSKIILNPIEIDGDPYRELQDGGWIEYPEEAVCAIQYEDDRIHYAIATFDNESAAENNGYIVTHKGHCGTCSTLQDLATYLYHRDLTTPVRRCSAMVWFPNWSIFCLEELGFSAACAETWYCNAKNTARECLRPCLASWIRQEPFNKPDGSLNDCLACDEECSGPIFKYVAGRTRRNSGIRSEIGRPEDEVYPIVHDYY
jgi:hypothetical protein